MRGRGRETGSITVPEIIKVRNQAVAIKNIKG